MEGAYGSRGTRAVRYRTISPKAAPQAAPKAAHGWAGQ